MFHRRLTNLEKKERFKKLKIYATGKIVKKMSKLELIVLKQVKQMGVFVNNLHEIDHSHFEMNNEFLNRPLNDLLDFQLLLAV